MQFFSAPRIRQLHPRVHPGSFESASEVHPADLGSNPRPDLTLASRPKTEPHPPISSGGLVGTPRDERGGKGIDAEAKLLRETEALLYLENTILQKVSTGLLVYLL